MFQLIPSIIESFEKVHWYLLRSYLGLEKKHQNVKIDTKISNVKHLGKFNIKKLHFNLIYLNFMKL